MANPTATPPLMAESDLTYTPPPEADPAEQADFQQSLKDIVSEIEGEYEDKPEFTEEELLADEAPKPPELEVPAEEQESKEDPAIARGMERLVSREVAIQARETAIQAREARAQALESELTQLRAQMPAKDITEKLYHSPTEAIKAMGHDPETVVRLMIAEQLEAKGQPVPPELKEFVKEASTTRRIKALEAQLAQRQRAEEATTFFNTVALGAREYVKSVDSKALPTLAGIVAANPERAHREIMEEITNDARLRAAADPDGQPMTYQEAARRVETRLAELKGLFGPALTDTTKQVSVKPVVPPQNKPPVRPLKPWEKKGEDLYAQGIKEAEREFYKQEALAKRR